MPYEIIFLWIACGLMGTAYQVLLQCPENEKKQSLWKLILIGIVFGPINLMTTFEDKTKK